MKSSIENLFYKNTFVTRKEDALDLAMLALDDPEKDKFYEESAEFIFCEKILSNTFTNMQAVKIVMLFDQLLTKNDERHIKIKTLKGIILIYTSFYQDPSRGIPLLEEAYQKGDRLACYYLGIAWLYSLAGEKKALDERKKKCEEYFEKSLWHPFSSFVLGNIYKQNKQFEHYFFHCSNIFNIETPCQFAIVKHLYTESYQKMNVEKAWTYLLKIGLVFNKRASKVLVYDYESNVDEDIALENLELAAEQSDIGACTELAKKYFGENADIQKTAERIHRLIVRESPLGWFCQGFKHERAHKYLEALNCYRKASIAMLEKITFKLLEVRICFLKVFMPVYHGGISRRDDDFFINMHTESMICSEFVRKIQNAQLVDPEEPYDKKFAELMEISYCNSDMEGSALWTKLCKNMMQISGRGESLLWMLRLPLLEWKRSFDIAKLDDFPFVCSQTNTMLKKLKYYFMEFKNNHLSEEKRVIEKILRLYANQIENNLGKNLTLNRWLIFSQTPELIQDAKFNIAGYMLDLDLQEAKEGLSNLSR